MSTSVRTPCGAVAKPGRDGTPCSASARKWVLAATILTSSMAFIDGTVVQTSPFPTLQAQLHTSMVDVQWVVEAYALCLAALLLVGGSLGDRFGRRRVFVIGVIMFAAASMACGLASGIRMLVAARATQGVGAALVVREAAILSAAFSGGTRPRRSGHRRASLGSRRLWAGLGAAGSSITCRGAGHLVARRIRPSGKLVDAIHLQPNGTVNAVAEGTRRAARLVLRASGARREPCPVSDLIVGVECGGSDTTSGFHLQPDDRSNVRPADR